MSPRLRPTQLLALSILPLMLPACSDDGGRESATAASVTITTLPSTLSSTTAGDSTSTTDPVDPTALATGTSTSTGTTSTSPNFSRGVEATPS